MAAHQSVSEREAEAKRQEARRAQKKDDEEDSSSCLPSKATIERVLR